MEKKDRTVVPYAELKKKQQERRKKMWKDNLFNLVELLEKKKGIVIHFPIKELPQSQGDDAA